MYVWNGQVILYRQELYRANALGVRPGAVQGVQWTSIAFANGWFRPYIMRSLYWGNRKIAQVASGTMLEMLDVLELQAEGNDNIGRVLEMGDAYTLLQTRTKIPFYILEALVSYEYGSGGKV
jgi:hypothetical protein